MGKPHTHFPAGSYLILHPVFADLTLQHLKEQQEASAASSSNWQQLLPLIPKLDAYLQEKDYTRRNCDFLFIFFFSFFIQVFYSPMLVLLLQGWQSIPPLTFRLKVLGGCRCSSDILGSHGTNANNFADLPLVPLWRWLLWFHINCPVCWMNLTPYFQQDDL